MGHIARGLGPYSQFPLTEEGSVLTHAVAIQIIRGTQKKSAQIRMMSYPLAEIWVPRALPQV